MLMPNLNLQGPWMSKGVSTLLACLVCLVLTSGSLGNDWLCNHSLLRTKTTAQRPSPPNPSKKQSSWTRGHFSTALGPGASSWKQWVVVSCGIAYIPLGLLLCSRLSDHSVGPKQTVTCAITSDWQPVAVPIQEPNNSIEVMLQTQFAPLNMSSYLIRTFRDFQAVTDCD